MAEGQASEVPAVGEQVKVLVDRFINRGIKGVEYFRSPAPAVGVSRRELIYGRGTLQLFHYPPVADEIYRIPLLMIMATSHRGSVFDLAEGQSFVQFLQKAGYDVYIVDWEVPGAHESRLGLDDYVYDFLPTAIKQVQNHTGEQDVTLVGYCMGGVLSVIYQALHPGGPIKNLVTFTTPVDFTKMQLFSNWSDQRYFDVDRLVDTLGNVPGDMLFSSFAMLKPTSRAVGQIRLWDNMWNDEFVTSYRRFDRWLADMLPLPGEFFRQTVKQLLWDNGLTTGNLSVRGNKVDLANIKVPFLHVIAEHDHIVPFEASHPLVELVGSKDKNEIMLKGGHVSLIAGPNAVRRLWPNLDLWLQERST